MSTSTEAMKKIMEGMAQVCEGIAEQLAILQEEIEEVLEESIPDEEPEPLKKDLTPISTGRKGASKSTQRKTPARKKKADAPVKEDASAKGDKPEMITPENEKAVPEETKAVETDITGAETTEKNEPLQEEAAESTEEEAAEDSRPPADTGPGDNAHGDKGSGDKAPGAKASTDTSSAAETSAVALTMDDLTSVIVAKIKQHRPNSEKIQKIVQSYGVEKLPDLPASKYESFLADVSKL